MRSPVLNSPRMGLCCSISKAVKCRRPENWQCEISGQNQILLLKSKIKPSPQLSLVGEFSLTCCTSMAHAGNTKIWTKIMHLSMLSRRGGGGGGRAWGWDLTFLKNLPSNSLPTGKSFQSNATKFPHPGLHMHCCQISQGWTQQRHN